MEEDHLQPAGQQTQENETNRAALESGTNQPVSSGIENSTPPSTGNDPKGNTSSDGAGEVVKPVSAKEKNPKKM